ncbi:site-specific DNA-methyltransferase [Roseomonas sp. HF4]|uniref:site-specific DNA-methyltransferase n=1 Tax=Roseomonas sp. HF4 TaxID=2562313 RepID=UPI003513DD41
MASLAEREGLRGQVQCIYFDPPYGIKFNSNFQWSTTSRDVKDGDRSHVTREPEQVRAFRDTWRDGIHSYLTYLRDRLTVARDLLHESGSIFVQIGEENLHLIRSILDEIFGPANFITNLIIRKTGSHSDDFVGSSVDYVVWYSKDRRKAKFRQLHAQQILPPIDEDYYVNILLPDGIRRRMTKEERLRQVSLPKGSVIFRYGPITGQGPSKNDETIHFRGVAYPPKEKRHWSTSTLGMYRVIRADRMLQIGSDIAWDLRWDEVPKKLNNIWEDTQSGGFGDQKRYVVETTPVVIERCVLMVTDPGDLVLDPTCGSGTTAYVAEQWGRRWITIDTSRVSLALARSRLMGARYPYYLLADSPEGQRKEAEVTRTAPKTAPTAGRLRLGFVYERVPHITLKSIASNAEIDVVWEQAQTVLEPLRAALNAALGKSWEEWQIPREAGDPWHAEAAKTWEELRLVQDKPTEAAVLLQKLNKQLGRSYTLAALPEAPRDPWSAEPTRLHAEWWKARIARQKEIDASIAAKADVEYLYDKPYEDRGRIRVAGPFTVESLSPHRALTVDWNDELVDPQRPKGVKGMAEGQAAIKRDFAAMIIENLRSAGVQQADKADHIRFTSLVGWPGALICAEGRYMEGEQERRAGILIGPEFGTLTRPDLVAAAREAADAGFDALIACAFAYDAHSAEFDRLGRVRVLRARMNPDLHMAQDLKATGKGNLFVIFGEPDIKIEPQKDGQLRVRIKGVDVFKPQTGEVESEGTDKIALWMIDTDYNEESFFVRHAYFLGANDPYKALKTTLKAEVDEAAWSSLNSDVSYPFPKPAKGRIAVKVINHLGDEVMKVFAVA